jgi:hypothetical protein
LYFSGKSTKGIENKMLCKCGCGEVTKLQTKTNTKQRRVKGLPNDFVHGHNQSFWGKVGEKMNKEKFELVPHQMRERTRQDYLPAYDVSKYLMTAEEKAAAAERKRQRAAEVAADEEKFQKEKEAAEAEYMEGNQ